MTFCGGGSKDYTEHQQTSWPIASEAAQNLLISSAMNPNLLVLTLMIFAGPFCQSWAAKPTIIYLKPQIRTAAIQEQIKRLQAKMEQELKRKFSAKETRQLNELVKKNESATLIPIGDLGQESTKLYCHGLQADFGVNQIFATCYHLWTLNRYEMNLFGHGISMHVAYSIFSADIVYRASLADRQDPLNAEFEVTKSGLTVVGGRTWIRGHGDQGQLIHLEGYNFGFGIDSTPSAKINLRASR